MSDPIAIPRFREVRSRMGITQAQLVTESGVPLHRVRCADAGRSVARSDAQAIADAMTEPIRGREWFPDVPEVRCALDSWAAEVAA